MKDKEDLIMAYVAGLIDGDGSLSLIRENRVNGFKYYPCIQLSNVFEEMVTFLHDTFGGIKKIKSRQTHSKKTQYVWNVRGLESCKNVLLKILPFLVLKQRQGQKLLNYICNLSDRNPETERLEIQGFNLDSHTSEGSVSKQAKKNTDEETFWAYFAGIMDTEGSFSIKKTSPSWGCKSYRFTPMIQLTMASFDAMNHIRKNFCFGRICFPKAKSTQRGFTYKLMVIKSTDCIEMINRLNPYLRFKCKAAGELVNFCQNLEPVKHKQKGVSESELKFRMICYEKVKQYNEYGVYKPSLIDSEARQGNEGQV